MKIMRHMEKGMKYVNVIECDDINVGLITEQHMRICNEYNDVGWYRLFDYNTFDSDVKFNIVIERKGNMQAEFINVKIIECAPIFNYLLLDQAGVKIEISDMIEFIATRN